MHQYESALDRARRQVDEAEARVNAQAALIDKLHSDGCEAMSARIRLGMLCNALDLKRLYLALEE